MFANLKKKIFIVVAFPWKAGFKPTHFLNPNYFLNGLIFAPWLRFHNKKRKRSRRKWVAFNWVYCCIGNLQRPKNSITCSRNIDPPRFSAETGWQLLPATIRTWLSKYNDNFGQQVIDLFLMWISSVILNNASYSALISWKHALNLNLRFGKKRAANFYWMPLRNLPLDLFIPFYVGRKL